MQMQSKSRKRIKKLTCCSKFSLCLICSNRHFEPSAFSASKSYSSSTIAFQSAIFIFYAEAIQQHQHLEPTSIDTFLSFPYIQSQSIHKLHISIYHLLFIKK